MSSVFLVYRPAPPGDPHDSIQKIYDDLSHALIDFLDAVNSEESASLHWSS